MKSKGTPPGQKEFDTVATTMMELVAQNVIAVYAMIWYCTIHHHALFSRQPSHPTFLIRAIHFHRTFITHTPID